MKEHGENGTGTGQFTYLSLFCGCGGLDHGFQQRGFKCIGAYDSDAVAVEHHKRNLSSPAEVRDLSSDGISEWRSTKPTVVLAGPPCGGFSIAGKRRLDDPRNHLLLIAGRIAVQIMPRMLVLENVMGAASGAHKKFWDGLHAVLRGVGYSTVTLICQCDRLGLAQVRTRMVMVAWRKKDCSVFLPELPATTLSQALLDVTNLSNHEPKYLPAGSDLQKIATHIKPGQKLSNVRGGERAVHTWSVPEVFGETTKTERELLEAVLRLRRRERLRLQGDADPVSVSAIKTHLGRDPLTDIRALLLKGYLRRVGKRFDLTHTFNGKFRRLSWDAPSLTVDTRFGDPRYFLHPSEHRGFTVREAARIQGFPDSFVFHGNEKDQFRLIGNAVPPPVSDTLAVLVRNMLLS